LARQGETGVLLSGGLDSASIATQAAATLERQSRRLWAFTWTSPRGDGIDETPLSRTFIRSRPNVVEHPVEADTLWPLSRYPEAYADPSSPETNAYPDLLLVTLEAARQQGVTVLMNGIGGDPVAGWLAPDLALLLRGRLGSLWQRWSLTGLRHAGLVRELWSLARRPYWPDWLTPEGRLQATEAGLDRPLVSWRTFSSHDGFRRTALANLANTAALERFDRLSRRFAVRIEAPWHDPDLRLLVLALPDRALASIPPAKRLVRAAMARSLPDAILHASTDKRRTRSDLRERGLLVEAAKVIEQILSNSRLEELGLVTGSRLLTTYREKASKREIMPRLWETLTTEGWLRSSANL
jgi:asparagine synthetase B (glutamine-hydrolysing)